jgi:hypothetical protein
MEQISWYAPEYIHTEKTSDWYWIVGIVTLSLAIIAIIFNDVIFAILIVIAVATLTLYATRIPTLLEIEISSAGVRNGDTYHTYDDLESYWIETRDAFPKVIFKSKKKLSLYISILIEDADPYAIDELLSQYLPKVEHREPFLEKLMIWMGF